MKKIVGLIGSPRKLGNSELIVKEISRNIPEDLEARLAHRSWLMGMKDKFKEKKEILKKVSIGYSNEGKWIHKKGED
jgi:hypothetical protein